MKIQIVDTEDKLIGVKERSEIDFQTDIHRVSALWITNSLGQALLAKRAATKDKDPGKWGPAVSGTVDEGETYEENIYKEAEEEIGLVGVVFELGPKMFMDQPKKFFCQWYLALLDREAEDFTIQTEEVDELRWVGTDQLKQELKLNPTNYIDTMQKIVHELGI